MSRPLPFVAICAALGAAASFADAPLRLKQVIQLMSPSHGCRVIETATEQAPIGTTITVEWVCQQRQSTAFLATEMRIGEQVAAVDTNGYRCRGNCTGR